MFRKGRQTSRQFDEMRSEPDGLEDAASLAQEPIKEERMVDRDRSVAASSDGGGTFLSTDAEFKGALKFSKELRINGRFEGEIASSGTVHVGAQGDVQAEISVGSAVVEGKVKGNITASDRVELRSTAQMIGDIKASKMIVEEGVVFVGRCEVSSERGSEYARSETEESEPLQLEVGVGR
jgi:cytoskeletal protein CcmA (bactofilin family)